MVFSASEQHKGGTEIRRGHGVRINLGEKVKVCLAYPHWCLYKVESLVHGASQLSIVR